ncbi:MAG: arylamine N-acetyltransferase [Deltaproteobacteria bacterium]|nr:arylamine N-acetyltransferase [Deltaproteobacteria bacterium]
MSLDLDAYFARIGYAGPRTPTLETLDAITRAHTSTIPFENLDVLLGKRWSLEPEGLFRKLVTERRGGYCFEQNGLLLEVLTQLGFNVRPLSARVRLDRPRDYIPARTHMFLRVELPDGPRLTDVGVGALSLTQSLRLETDEEQKTPHEPRRIIREEGKFFHQVRLGDVWSDVCEFTGEEMPTIDRELGHWYTSAHPGSHFRNRLIVARAGPDGTRLTLLNDELKRRGRDGHAEVLKLRSPDELLAVMREHFGLAFPADTRFGPPGSIWPS